jgi:ribbon-helix-helix CopG family protein
MLSSSLASDNMIRMQVNLDKQEHALAKKEAKALGISIAEFIRRAIRDKLPPRRSRPWMRYFGMVESGDSRSSQSVDDVVYCSTD